MRRYRSPLSSNEDDTKTMMNNEVLVQESTYKCKTCGKTFSNGKTLGGHRRSHFLKMKRNHHQSQGNAYFNDDSYDDEEIAGKKKQTCYICENKFPIKNVFYGHMIRSHLDVVSKGVSPPSNYDIQKSFSSNSSKYSTQQNKEDNLSLPKWQNRGKRGRKCIGVVEGATNLLHLMSNKYFCTLSIDEQKSPEFPLPIKKRYCSVDESSSNGNGKKELIVNKNSFVLGCSLKIENKCDGNGDESDNNDEEKSNDAATEQNKLNFDLNDSYLVEE
ncbi:zinc finger protein 726 [Medicago truncatula]|uniref:C2H2-type zinc finger protein n=2 Tax=Medicago truncatula TaxID=3880 RepID=G7KM35_MEDTR|nr:zinc finger protein 726 [Medicago truncatula]AES76556.1 C2H2-type zinc finger protein [Medicago truncatula]